MLPFVSPANIIEISVLLLLGDNWLGSNVRNSSWQIKKATTIVKIILLVVSPIILT